VGSSLNSEDSFVEVAVICINLSQHHHKIYPLVLIVRLDVV
jgi:hypothetical protein